MSTILEPRSENFKRTMLCGYCSAGLSAEAAVESLAADFPALTTQEVSAWFARFRAGNFEIGENVSINAEGIVIDRSVRLKRELDDAEQVDGEPLARMNPNLPVVPKREVDEEDGANQHPQVNGAANHIVAQQQPAPHNLPIVAVNENPANGGPQVVPNIEEEDGEGADHARANPANEGNQAPAINRNQREARARPVRRAQRAVAIPPQNPVHPMPIQPAMYPVNLANQFPPVPLLFQITPQFLPEMQFYQFGVQFPMHYWQHQNPPNIEDSLRPFEASTRGMEKFNGMLSCRHSPDHAIYFEIMRYGLKFTKLEKY
ncbi:Protein CBG04479 [Caenorhabditis briggsae]|uniref:Protein CBG04479 n=1 Tax=Caenorhabditis briggsae TaxID=6238 RepID=A8WXS9_CAEBR|nr:Protein CBG04479 [Caenorhabditis briggsae]CAP25203.2 Protein CBG04479 [Caenorhabditis briggsae]